MSTPAQGADVLAVEYLYAIQAEHHEGDDNRFYVPKKVITFRVAKKTAKRIYYVRSESRGDVGYIDRQQIEAAGEIWRKSAGWWEPDARLYLQPPVLEVYAPAPDLAELKAAMRAAHPDMGGSEEVPDEARPFRDR